MAFTAKDGSKHTNRDSMKRADAKHASAAPAPVAAQPEPEGDESPESVAEQHGPAVEIQIAHNHEAGQHHVHSVHADGHEHHSDHASADEAHDHAKKLAGAVEAPAEEPVEEGY